jgi:thiamine-phosphate diphosphorylase
VGIVTLCLVTDRRRMGGSRESVLAVASAAVASGVDLIQIRERDLDADDLRALVERVVAIVRGSRTRVVVNDRLDVALAAGADGVHLRGDSIPVAAARRMTPGGFLVGRSVHTVADAEHSAGADYLIAGTVFPSASKPDARAWLGLDGLGAIVRATTIPVLGIGGITLDNIEGVAATGAAGVAAVGLFAGASYREVVAQARTRFDSLKTAP